MTTDGVPENVAMCSLLVGGAHGALAFLFALVMNGSQSMMSTNNMIENHHVVTLLAWVARGSWSARR